MEGASRRREVGNVPADFRRVVDPPADGVSLTPDLWSPMPDTLTPVGVPALPQLTLQQPHEVWSALRTQLLEGTPEPECIRRIRALLFHLYDTHPARMRGLHALFVASPAICEAVARQSGWCDAMSARGVGWDLALTAAVFGETGE